VLAGRLEAFLEGALASQLGVPLLLETVQSDHLPIELITENPLSGEVKRGVDASSGVPFAASLPAADRVLLSWMNDMSRKVRALWVRNTAARKVARVGRRQTLCSCSNKRVYFQRSTRYHRGEQYRRTLHSVPGISWRGP
jgi:hypothetical protein